MSDRYVLSAPTSMEKLGRAGYVPRKEWVDSQTLGAGAYRFLSLRSPDNGHNNLSGGKSVMKHHANIKN